MKIFCSIIEKETNKIKVARFLTTIPSNLGFFNLGTVESYPTGGGGPTAYGPTSYFGSDPRPAEQGDNLNNPINLGDFSAIFKSQIISNTKCVECIFFREFAEIMDILLMDPFGTIILIILVNFHFDFGFTNDGH